MQFTVIFFQIFESVNELVEYYKSNPLKLVDKNGHLKEEILLSQQQRETNC